LANYRLQRLDGTIEGPLTSSELKELASRGRISPADRVAPDGTDRWVPAMRVNGIREILESRALSQPEPDFTAPQEAIPLETADLAKTREISRTSGTPSTALSPATAPQYNVLRCVSGWLVVYGWLVVTGGIFYSYFFTILLGREFLGQDPPGSPGYIAGLVLLCIVASLATTAMFRRLAQKSSRLTGVFAATAFLPLVPFVGIVFQKDTIPPEAGVSVFQSVGASVLSLILGSVLVAVGEFLLAHADIATNSWRSRTQD
jgi:hypothetical protein